MTKLNDNDISQIVLDVENHRGDYIAGVEQLADAYRDAQARITELEADLRYWSNR